MQESQRVGILRSSRKAERILWVVRQPIGRIDNSTWHGADLMFLGELPIRRMENYV
jgi:hypothetical protein